ncbi:Acyl-CoA N-acyltransferase [Penicillium sp. IBT 16267x]|nr:Acyl-CoA N-acyltransferase [Penicillium sp. IBT 16267x]
MAEGQSPEPRIYEHNDKATTLLPLLASHLPLSSALLRRIQHGLAYPTPTAKILATFPPSASPSPDKPWLAARVDLFRGRETQIILYSSLEAEHTSIQPIGSAPPIPESAVIVTPSDGSTPGAVESHHHASPDLNYTVATLHSANPAFLTLAREQLLALLAYIKANLLPEYLASLPPDSEKKSAEAQSPNGVPLIPAPDPRAFLIGTLHTGLFTLLLESGVFPHPDAGEASSLALLSGLKVHRYDNPPYSKFFFPREVFTMRDDEAEIPLPDGYRFHDRKGRIGVLDSHLGLVQSRTSIPRSRAQLSSMVGMAIYHDSESDTESDEDEMPIAWAFLGVDGPLATLHVEPEHRGKGLALCLSKETMRRGMDPTGIFGADRLDSVDEKLRQKTTAWVHAEVAQTNKASRRVMEKVGGEVMTTVMWVVIELCD